MRGVWAKTCAGNGPPKAATLPYAGVLEHHAHEILGRDRVWGRDFAGVILRERKKKGAKNNGKTTNGWASSMSTGTE